MKDLFLLDSVLQVVDVDAIINGDPKRSGIVINKAPKCTGLLSRHYKWWQ